nr:hypothetical protein UMIGIWAJ_UMIGIWAJ_CDS_0003 [Microvirus sp.]
MPFEVESSDFFQKSGHYLTFHGYSRVFNLRSFS